MPRYNIGDLITFSYPTEGTRAHDKYPRVLVLHPDWQGSTHGLNFNYLSDDEINVIRMIIDPFYEMQYRDALRKKNPNLFKELEIIITSPAAGAQGMYNRVKITSPRGFYLNVIKPFIRQRGYEPYRKYRTDKVLNPKILTPSRVMMGEHSLAKWKKEREELSKAVIKAFKDAKTEEQKKRAKELKTQLDKADSMSKRKSILAFFDRFVKYWKGPKGPRF